MDLIAQIWRESGLYQITSGQVFMLGVCLLLLYLGIVRKFEPLLLVTIGFGGLLSNIPGVEIATGDGLLHLTYEVGIENGVFPLIIFMGVGAMTDFGPLLANPRTLFLGAAAQFGIFATLLGALGLTSLGIMDFSVREAAAIGDDGLDATMRRCAGRNVISEVCPQSFAIGVGDDLHGFCAEVMNFFGGTGQ